MTAILLSTLNARWAHSAFGLRYLLANMGELRESTQIAEFDISQRPLDIVEAILRREPRIVGFGVYVWNVEQTTAVVADLKRIRPELTVILGGPEVSFPADLPDICSLADYIITGEADVTFAQACRDILAGQPPAQKIIEATPPDLAQLVLPYDLYTDQDLTHRVVYVEASRGCPFGCEFCLSSVGPPVHSVPLAPFLQQMQKFLGRGLRHFKFVDRTFNANVASARAILNFFLERYVPGLFLHFEMIPDHLPQGLREIITRFPAGALQFEVGIQTFNEQVADRIGRRQDNSAAEENLRFLRTQTGVHIHVDLVAGLPGETLDSFAAGFDRLLALRPQEIQLGILKRLRGAPISRHDVEWGMVYSPRPPYEILQTKLIDFATMQRIRRFARFWDLLVNSGNFPETAPMIWGSFVVQASTCSRSEAVASRIGQERVGTPALPGTASPFGGFLSFSDWLFSRTGQTHAIALDRLAELLFIYLTEQCGNAPAAVAASIARDWTRCRGSDLPVFLRPLLPASAIPARSAAHPYTLPRQSRHRRSPAE